MGVYWRESVPVEFADESVGETRAVEAGAMTISFERLKTGFSTVPLARGLPSDSCRCPHWAVVLRGKIRLLGSGDGELVEAGSAYYLAPGHNVLVEEDCEVVEFSPTAERAATLERFERRAVELGLVGA